MDSDPGHIGRMGYGIALIPYQVPGPPPPPPPHPPPPKQKSSFLVNEFLTERGGVGERLFEGGDYLKHFRQRGAIVRGRRLIEGRLLFEEIW